MERQLAFGEQQGDEWVGCPVYLTVPQFLALMQWLKHQTLQYDLVDARDAINALSTFADRL